ncbi:MAG: hypothetical protein EZS28_015294 [Streblomastix strix]|uniref:Uncharacterized protein n=1 Tax=Streblomastix strix TaxID=222440 RepID=A0A5J4W2X2_9EUKA|nr:MAG: hypothetical protein EZS28_015294 [Streblomastix strix]
MSIVVLESKVSEWLRKQKKKVSDYQIKKAKSQSGALKGQTLIEANYIPNKSNGEDQEYSRLRSYLLVVTADKGVTDALAARNDDELQEELRKEKAQSAAKKDSIISDYEIEDAYDPEENLDFDIDLENTDAIEKKYQGERNFALMDDDELDRILEQKLHSFKEQEKKDGKKDKKIENDDPTEFRLTEEAKMADEIEKMLKSLDDQVAKMGQPKTKKK